ncbi:uncharacterized protein LOC127808109 isoform X2 [Diospyros lotus]|uniref:uncharacterized protein LOC127808109 isoform X2 n=1 Tax=Diospyros lotus TaxID=55363 RepID=UPI00225655AC|nr:uncharacterized protein LOC127808109 isoform X2 [Diospyros lotus]
MLRNPLIEVFSSRLLFLLILSSVLVPGIVGRVLNLGVSAPAVQLHVEDNRVEMQNGILQLTLSNPGGVVLGIKYGGIDNLLELRNEVWNGGFWDLDWIETGNQGKRGEFDSLEGTSMKVILQTEEQLELSFTRIWDPSMQGKQAPLNIDKRFIVLRGCSGFYSYAIFEHLEDMPAFNLSITRLAFMLNKDKFHYMAIANNRQRHMPHPDDRLPGRCQELAYPEAVRLINPLEPEFENEVDDKYQYSCENKDNRVHGWISFEPPVGFWQITPSNEFRTGGPFKQDLTSHVNPTTLAIFVTSHYAGTDLVVKFQAAEIWKKVFGPVFIYLNSVSDGNNPLLLWDDAIEQMKIETKTWPYNFPESEDFPRYSQRGKITGRLLVQDRYVSKEFIPANGGYVGLAPPGDAGSWQRESKGYQFWTTAAEGCLIDMGNIVYEPPRNGPTLWEIGVPDRSAAEFYIPDPNPIYVNKLCVNHSDRFRQYGLWERYADLYPDEDLTYRIGVSDYRKDWFFVQVTRKIGEKKYKGTTWQIKFKLENINRTGTYKLKLALASAHYSELQVRVNDAEADPLFSSGVIGSDNAIARHGIHGLYWWFDIGINGTQFIQGDNTIYLTQPKNSSPFQGIMYDYIRLEGSPASS